jgi:hypothetical protein
VRSVWLSPGFPAAPAALLDALGADFTLAPALATPPTGSIAIVTGFERDLLARLASRPPEISLLVITPPGEAPPADEIPSLRADAVVAAASISEVADALRRLPAAAVPASAGAGAGGPDLPWWIRPAQDTPLPTGQTQHHTEVYATTPLPAFGLPAVGEPATAPTETLAVGGEQPSGRRFALTGRQARIASIAAVVVAVAATGLAVGLDSHSSSPANAAATTPLSGNGNNSPFGSSNGFGGANPFNGQSNGSGSGQDNSQSDGQSNGQGSQPGGSGPPQFGAPGPLSGQGRSGAIGGDVRDFLACLKQNGVSLHTNQQPFFDPTDPQLRAALTKCASVAPFGRLRDGLGNRWSNSTGASGNTSRST